MADPVKRESHLTTTAISPFSLTFDDTVTNNSSKSSITQFKHTHSKQTSLSSTIADVLLGDSMPSSTHAVKQEDYGREASSPPELSTRSTAPDRVNPAKPTFRTLLCFTALTLSIFLVALDTVLIPTALPTISLSFHIPDSLFAWTGSAYLLANAASVPFWGKLSDIFGRKPIIIIANFIFLAGSIVCAASVSAEMLVAGRAVQGLGGGGVVVLVHVCVADTFAIRDRSFYLGIVGAAWAVASALGPVLGGVFAQQLNWRWCFYINLPITSISTILLFFTLNLHNPRTPLVSGLLSMDWLGSVTILAATLLLLVGLQLGGESTYAKPLVICLIVFGVLFCILFPATQYLSEKQNPSRPIMPLRIFKDVSNLSALGVCACDALVFNSVAYFLPLYFQIVLSVTPSTTGLYMLAVAIPLALVSFGSGVIIEKTGRFLEVLQLGLALMTLGVGLLVSFNTELDLAKILGFLVVIGIGFGPNFHAPLIALQTRIRDSDMAAGIGAFGFVRMLSGAIGVVVGQIVFQILMRPQFGDFVSSGLDVGFAERLAGGEAIAEAAAVADLPRMQREAVRGGMMTALRGTWIFYTAVSGAGLLVSFGIKRTKLVNKGTGKEDIDPEKTSSVDETSRRKMSSEH